MVAEIGSQQKTHRRLLLASANLWNTCPSSAYRRVWTGASCFPFKSINDTANTPQLVPLLPFAAGSPATTSVDVPLRNPASAGDEKPSSRSTRQSPAHFNVVRSATATWSRPHGGTPAMPIEAKSPARLTVTLQR